MKVWNILVYEMSVQYIKYSFFSLHLLVYFYNVSKSLIGLPYSIDKVQIHLN